jgi:hypothetical protein
MGPTRGPTCAGFILEEGLPFEDGVMALIRGRLPTVRIGTGWRDGRDLERAVATVEAMRDGVPVGRSELRRCSESRARR